jgi:hypothetical protein
MATIRFFIRAGKTEERDVSVWANVFISDSAYHSITDHQTYEITPSLLQTLQEA